MRLRFHIDPETGSPHIYSHGVEESEVEDVLDSPLDGWRSRRGTRIALGRTSGGRYLQVVYVDNREPGEIFVITAYDLRGKPLAALRRRMRRRGR